MRKAIDASEAIDYNEDMRMAAKYGGQCQCGARFAAGATVFWARADKRVTQCPACSGGDSAPAAPVSFEACIERETYRAADFMIFQATSRALPPDAPVAPGRPFTAKYGGPAVASLRAGDFVQLTGEWVRDPRYGMQFRATGATPAIIASDEALVRYLERFPQVGPARAREILQVFGGREATMELLEVAPERLAEIKGITAERAQEIHEAYMSDAAIRESLLYLVELGVPSHAQSWILDRWGPATKEFVSEDPYVLMEAPRLGFRTVDEIAKKAQKVADDDPRRLAAFVYDLLSDAEQEGHVWSSIDDILALYEQRNRRRAG